jgi:hypothetical protein
MRQRLRAFSLPLLKLLKKSIWGGYDLNSEIDLP